MSLWSPPRSSWYPGSKHRAEPLSATQDMCMWWTDVPCCGHADCTQVKGDNRFRRNLGTRRVEVGCAYAKRSRFAPRGGTRGGRVRALRSILTHKSSTLISAQMPRGRISFPAINLRLTIAFPCLSKGDNRTCSDPKQHRRDKCEEMCRTQVAFHLMTEPVPVKNHVRELPNTLRKISLAGSRVRESNISDNCPGEQAHMSHRG